MSYGKCNRIINFKNHFGNFRSQSYTRHRCPTCSLVSDNKASSWLTANPQWSWNRKCNRYFPLQVFLLSNKINQAPYFHYLSNFSLSNLWYKGPCKLLCTIMTCKLGDLPLILRAKLRSSTVGFTKSLLCPILLITPLR